MNLVSWVDRPKTKFEPRYARIKKTNATNKAEYLVDMVTNDRR